MDITKFVKGYYNYTKDRLKACAEEFEKYSEMPQNQPIHNTSTVKTETPNNNQSSAKSQNELLNQLIKNYNAADEGGKENIRKIAELEAKKNT